MSDLQLSDLSDGRSRRGEEDVRRGRRRSRRRRTSVVLLLCVALFAGAAWAVYGIARPLLEDWNAPTDYAGPAGDEVTVQILAGSSGRAIGAVLEESDVVLTAGAFVAAAQQDPRAGGIQPGTYELPSQLSGQAALEALLDPQSRVSLRFTLREGLRAPAALGEISEATGFTPTELQEALADPEVGLPPQAGGDPEGYLFPATYQFDPDVTAVQVVTALVARYQQAMAAVGVEPADQREVLVKASIIEAEGRTPQDMARISTVIDNRLESGTRLQMDSTVNFATGKQGITTTAEDRASDSPYNTYAAAGMPPGPINSPGEVALTAAVEPQPGPWLFFVTVDPDTGETRFATTEAEHFANVELFRTWLRENS